MTFAEIQQSSIMVAAVIVATAASPLSRCVCAEPVLTVHDLPKNSFGGADVAVRVSVSGEHAAPALILWSLEASEHRALARGEIELPATAQEVPVRLQFPPVKDGVVFPLRFNASLV